MVSSKGKEKNGYTKACSSRMYKGSKHALMGGSLLTFKIFKGIKGKYGELICHLCKKRNIRKKN
jgi:hypothetical protein